MKNVTTICKNEFEINSDLDLIPDMVTRILMPASKIFKDLYMLEVAIYEAIYNAIEHGNLEITKSRKKRMIEKGLYDNFLKKTAMEKECNLRKVKISTSIDTEKFTIVIKDEGNGFNWKTELNKITNSDCNLEMFSGYGLRIILSVFDEVFYNKKGNLLTLVKLKNKTGG